MRIPNDIGAVIRTKPRGTSACAMVSFSSASPSARMRAALAAARRPVSVSSRRRDVRCRSDAPIRASRRATAFDTVALDRLRSAAARANDLVSATFANTAQASRSGKRDMRNPETMNFHCFSFAILPPARSSGLGAK